ncbi:MAG: serine/threonine-protein kinase [Coxiellaceae bacterium]|nr:serine/threonine-protein kinase [Coxiellaceae bacterium]
MQKKRRCNNPYSSPIFQSNLPIVSIVPEHIVDFSDYAKQAFNPRNPASFRYDECVYTPSKKLGGGVFGEVWLCRSSDPTKSLALKREMAMHSGYYSEGEQFEHEAALNKKIYGIGEISGDPKDKTRAHYLIMRLINGMRLGEVFHRFLSHAAASDQEILRIWILLAAAVINFNKHGLVHGDLHSGNVMVSHSHDLVSLIDFGLTTSVGKLRNDCAIRTDKKAKYPFRPPETFSDVKNPTVLAQANQDTWAAGYHLSKVKALFLLD